MSKQIADMRFPLDVLEAAEKAKMVVEGKKRPRVHIFPIAGTDLEVFAKRDADGRPTFQRRKLTNQIKSPKVKARDVVFKACMEAIDESIQSKREGGEGVRKEVLRKAIKKCLTSIGTEQPLRMIMEKKSESAIINELKPTALRAVRQALAEEGAKSE